ncbi:putative polygalacturonase [Dendrobium catenatum]|uniref:Putative polygalacturonase n=1 Tax=Dendrobium catenatum TaxID=906689 RepID=A0A2I0VZ76_9ASPA|nr:putative polygalacturonase [Dendrobium catenatum]
MSGGIQDVRTENIVDVNSEVAVSIKTAIAHGGFVRDIFVQGRQPPHHEIRFLDYWQLRKPRRQPLGP